MAESKRWVVRDQGQIRGPFSTEEILNRISKGLFEGTEEISLFPGNNWILISQAPEFYDRLLDALEGVSSNVKSNSEVEDRDKEEELAPKPASEKPLEEISFEFKKIRKEVTSETVTRESKEPEVIELKDLRKELRKRKKQKSYAPLFLIGIVLLIAGYLLFTTVPKDGSAKIHLVGPEPGRSKVGVSNEKWEEGFRLALSSFERDDFDNYLSAQNKLVSLVESSPKNEKAMGFLCLTYRELWPYAFQDSKDLHTISKVAQMAKGVNPVGMYATGCHLVDLLAQGKFKEARSVVEATLQTLTTLEPFVAGLFEIKADLMLAEKEYGLAIDHLQKARKIWDRWIKTYLVEARAQVTQGNHSYAVTLYENILKSNSRHVIAKLDLGTLEERHFRHYEKALGLLSAGLASTRVPSIDEAQALLSLARIYVHKNQRKKALQYALDCVKLSSSNLECRRIAVDLGGIKDLKDSNVSDGVYVGDQFYKSGDYLAAQAEYKAAFEHDRKNGLAAMKAAACLWLLNQGSEAIVWLKKAIVADPNLIEAYFRLADYHSQKFDYVSAIKILKQGMRQKSNQYQIFRGLALVELRRGNAGGAATYAQKALHLYSSDIDSLIILAKSYLGNRNPEEALKAASKAVELDGGNIEAQLVYSRSAAALQGFDAGVQYLNELIRSFPYVIDYRVSLGELYFEEERYEEAENIFRQVVQIKKSEKRAYMKLGLSQQKQEKMADALDSLLMAASIDPSDGEPLYLIGQYYLLRNEPHEAIRQFERVAKINGQYPLVHYYTGRAALLSGDLGRALSEAEAEKRLNPNLADPYLLLAEIYTRSRDYGKCAAEIQRAIQLRPQASEVYIKLGQCYRLAGQFDPALAVIKVAEGKESGNAEVYRELGLIFEARGEIDEAIIAFRRYLQLAPTAEDKPDIEKRIQNLEKL